MKILSRTEFLALPENTLFCKYEPCVMGDLGIKGETWGNDFLVQSISDALKCNGSQQFHDILCRVEQTGESFDMDFNCLGRDGCFDDDQLFMVFEKKDVAKLIERLSECANV